MNIRIAWGALLLAIALPAFTPAAALAQSAQIDSDAKCVRCHSRSLTREMQDGEELSLQIAMADFEQSVHQPIGCAGCHADVAARKHPSREPIASRRALAVEHSQSCRTCHEANDTAYEGSIHASLVAAGDTAAPVCSDCHGSHAIRELAVYEPVSGAPCANCHEDIYAAYSQSVHGKARSDGNVIRAAHVQAPICADCHQAHDVSAVAAIDYLRDTCLDCHDSAADAHEKWLPNAGMHLSAVACAACHSPAAERRVDLQLYDRLEQVPVTRRGEGTEFGDRLTDFDAAGDGLDPVELWQLVRATGREQQAVDVTLRGRMEVTTGVAAHRIAPRSEAVRSCETCHQGGADGFQNVTVSISRPDGRKQRFDADREVLNSVVSVDSVGEFYAPGGTRIGLLDGLLVLALAAGFAIPAGHFTLGRILRRRQERKS